MGVGPRLIPPHPRQLKNRPRTARQQFLHGKFRAGVQVQRPCLHRPQMHLLAGCHHGIRRLHLGISPRAEKRPHPLGQQIPPPQRRHSVRQIFPRLRHSHSHSTTPQCPTVSCPKNAPCARSRIYSNPASLRNPPAGPERRRRALRHRHPARSARPDPITRRSDRPAIHPRSRRADHRPARRCGPDRR